MPVIKRNINSPVTSAGRASAPTMRLSAMSRAMSQANVKANNELVENSFKVGTAVTAGLVAGMNGQTTQDVGQFAYEGIDAEDKGGFKVNKFVDETVASLGGAKGMMNLENQNVAKNLVDSYQNGVKIGYAHAKLQSQAVITNATTASQLNFESSLRNENYDGAIELAWKTQTDELNKQLVDQNTTPAVKRNIQAYLEDPTAKADFFKKHSVKLANAIAESNAKKAEASVQSVYDANILSPIDDENAWNAVEATMQLQSDTGAIHYTPEEIEQRKQQFYADKASAVIRNPASTVHDLQTLDNYVKQTDVMSNEDKSIYNAKIDTAIVQNQNRNYKEAKDIVSSTLMGEKGFTLSGTKAHIDELEELNEITPTQKKLLLKDLEAPAKAGSKKPPLTDAEVQAQINTVKDLDARVAEIMSDDNLSIEAKERQLILVQKELNNHKDIKSSHAYQKASDTITLNQGLLYSQVDETNKAEPSAFKKYMDDIKKQFNDGDLDASEYQANKSSLIQARNNFYEMYNAEKKRNGVVTDEQIKTMLQQSYGSLNEDTIQNYLIKAQQQQFAQQYAQSGDKGRITLKENQEEKNDKEIQRLTEDARKYSVQKKQAPQVEKDIEQGFKTIGYRGGL